MSYQCTQNQGALAELYDAHNAWLFGWLRKKLGCNLDAADLMQDTFLRVLRRQADFRVIEEPRAYLTTVAHGLMVNHLRRRDLERAYLGELAQLPETEIPSVETRMIVLEALVSIDRMLDGLLPRVRQAFLLHQLEEMSHAEIAARLSVSVSSVRQYIARALLHAMQVLEAG